MQQAAGATAAAGPERLVLRDGSEYELVARIEAGSLGAASLMRNPATGARVAVKFIERGDKIDEAVRRAAVNHRSLRHPNIIRFREVVLTPTHLGIVMEHAGGGDLFRRVCEAPAGRLREAEARYFFQQLIAGVSYCHRMEIRHGDLTLEYTLIDESYAPRLKICDFRYSKSTSPFEVNSATGAPFYVAPEILMRDEHDSKASDVWACGVALHLMLAGNYPFGYPNYLEQMVCVPYAFPPHIPVSPDCKDLLSRIFVTIPENRITMAGIKGHPFYLRNLPVDLEAGVGTEEPAQQDVDEIVRVVSEAAAVPSPDPADNGEVVQDDLSDLFADLQGGGGPGALAGGAGAWDDMDLPYLCDDLDPWY